MRSTLAKTLPILYHSLTIFRAGLNMFCSSRTNSTSVPTVIACLSSSQTPSQMTAEMASASTMAMTKLNIAWMLAAPREACMLFSVCSEKRSGRPCRARSSARVGSR
jgi:hypothetical protein